MNIRCMNIFLNFIRSIKTRATKPTIDGQIVQAQDENCVKITYHKSRVTRCVSWVNSTLLGESNRCPFDFWAGFAPTGQAFDKYKDKD